MIHLKGLGLFGAGMEPKPSLGLLLNYFISVKAPLMQSGGFFPVCPRNPESNQAPSLQQPPISPKATVSPSSHKSDGPHCIQRVLVDEISIPLLSGFSLESV